MRRISRDARGKYHVTTTHGASTTAGGAVWGGFWGLLFGLLFFIPFAGWAVGAGMGALFGHLGKNAIDQTFQKEVRDYVQPGTSALFMIIEKATPDKAIAALEQYGGTVIRTSLSDEDTAALLNWMAKNLSDLKLPPGFADYSAAEIHGLRDRPLVQVGALRARLLKAASTKPHLP